MSRDPDMDVIVEEFHNDMDKIKRDRKREMELINLRQYLKDKKLTEDYTRWLINLMRT